MLLTSEPLHQGRIPKQGAMHVHEHPFLSTLLSFGLIKTQLGREQWAMLLGHSG